MLDLYEMNCLDMLDLWLPDQSVQTCITSPPYFGLRDYGHPEQIGLEKTPDEFVAKLVRVFRGVHRVLRDDGTLWLNLGDTYSVKSTYNAAQSLHTANEWKQYGESKNTACYERTCGVPAKNLLGIPWRVAFALQADGWYLRQDIIWQKPNPMPESVTDRCTKSHEYIFMLTKSPRYYFDHEAIKEPAAASSVARWNQDVDAQEGSDRVPGKTNGKMKAVGGSRSKRDSFKREDSKRAEVIPGQSVGTHRPDRDESSYDLETRNRRSVWNVSTKPYKGAHFATFPPDLIEPCVLAGSRPGDLVLDPFGGSGTTAGVALHHGRRAILCELNSEYAALVPSRVEAVSASLTKTAGNRAVATSAT